MINYQPLAEVLKLTAKKLNLEANSPLNREVVAVCDYLANPNLRIAVFGPFNHGKSTLLNAILGDKTLPIDLIPTTGAAITVKYGTDTRTRITLRSGEEIYRGGTDILKKFAILDGDRKMRDDVVAVEVFVPNSLLARGVEFLDLPGTNDREAQDNLVQEQLLGADLVIQLLDARKLMTLGERENLRDWLLDRGITSVIFVANFLNLLDPEEQKSVYNRLLFLAEGFRAQLPDGYSNIYRVDALPALRSRLKGDTQAATSSGLVTFESALQNIIASIQQNRPSVSTPRVEQIAIQLQSKLLTKIAPLQTQLNQSDRKSQTVNEIKKQAEDLIQKGFYTSANKLRDWLDIRNLRNKYQADAAVALAQNQFAQWEQETLKPDLEKLQQEINKWVNQAQSFFQQGHIEPLLIEIPSLLTADLANSNGENKNNDNNENNNNNLNEAGSFAVGGGIGWFLGGPIGAAVVGSVTYLLNRKIKEEDKQETEETQPETPEANYHRHIAKKCLEATDDYFENLSKQGLVILEIYINQANQIIQYQSVPESLETNQQRLELYRWSLILYTLNRQIEHTLKIQIKPEFQISQPTEPKIDYQPPSNNTQTSTHTQTSNHTSNRHTQSANTTYRYQRTGIKEEIGTVNRSQQQNTQTQTKNTTNTTYQHASKNANTSHQHASQKSNYQTTQPHTKPPTPEEIEVKFVNWEIEQELAQMKANMGQKTQQKSTQKNHTKQTQTHPKKPTDQNKINRAYKIFGLKPGASPSDIKNAYRRLVKKWHPDLFVGKPQELRRAQNNMHHINEAYNILINID